jgi:hypothetical protein
VAVQPLHPGQFHVNEAWIVFRLNDAPVSTDADGDFNLIALMDAASCFILSTNLIPASGAEPTRMESKRLLEEGRAHKQQLPKTLFVPNSMPADIFAGEAKRRGIAVVRVPEEQLQVFVGEAR